jgi:hypothetical protein
MLLTEELEQVTPGAGEMGECFREAQPDMCRFALWRDALLGILRRLLSGLQRDLASDFES